MTPDAALQLISLAGLALTAALMARIERDRTISETATPTQEPTK